MKRALFLASLLALGCQTEAMAREELEKDGYSDIVLTKGADGYSFEAKKDGEACTGSISVKKGIGTTNVSKLYQCGTPKQEEACGEKTPEVCFRMGGAKEKTGEMEAARALYATGCDAGNAGSCNDLGVMLVEGRGGPANMPDAAARFEKACALKDGNACKNLGITRGKLEPPQHEAAAEAFRQSCELGEKVGCFELGRSLLDGRGVPRNQEKGVVLFERACGMGDDQACGAHGLYLVVAEPRDVPKGEKLLIGACDKNVGEACKNLGVLVREGKVPPKDPAKAFGLFERACDLKDGGGCNALGYASERGVGTKRDLDKAIASYTKACELEEPLGCLNLGVAYRDGVGVAKDKDKSVSYFEKGCNGGEPKACDQAKALAGK